MEHKRYMMLKAMGMCVCCGKLKARDGKTTCQDCYDRHRKYNYPSLDKPEIKKKKKCGYTFEEISAMCKERNVSYGVMVAILEGKMKDPLTSE